jgi:hypothetical protein
LFWLSITFPRAGEHSTAGVERRRGFFERVFLERLLKRGFQALINALLQADVMLENFV